MTADAPWTWPLGYTSLALGPTSGVQRYIPGVTLRRRFRRWRLRLLSFLLPPRSVPRDVVRARQGNRELVGRATGFAGLWAIAALALTLVKLIIGFGGNSNYLAAVLERISLSGLASMTLATLVAGLIPFSLVWGVATIVNPAASSRARWAWGYALLLGMTMFPRVIPNLYWIVAVAGYLLMRFAQVRWGARRTASERSIDLVAWGRQNRMHQDNLMRALAHRARNAKDLDSREREVLVDEISVRRNLLAPSPEAAKIAAIWTAASGVIIMTVLAPPTFSASYMVETTQGSRPAYILRGPDDLLLIDVKTRVPTVWARGDVTSWRLCGPSDDQLWLFQPIGRSPDDSNLSC